ncbi:MAG: helicase RepA family protein [Acetobacteraceae bacterium]|nr:helicase RepA family protein [Acetobacteraceae bacterium]
MTDDPRLPPPIRRRPTLVSDSEAISAPATEAGLWRDYLDVAAALASPPPELDFVLPGLLASTLGVLVSPGGAGKSMLALQLAACVAAGRSLWGLLPSDPKAGTVIVVSAEDPAPILKHRLHSLARVPCDAKGYRWHADAEAVSRYRIKAAQGTGFGLGTWTGTTFEPSPEFERLRLEVEAARPRLVIVDTLNRCLAGISENDNAALGRIVSALEAMLAPAGAAGLVLHHVSKGAAREGQGDEQQAARGAGAITDNARWQGNLIGLPRDEAKARGIPDEDRRRWVRWAVSKSNYSPPPPDCWLWRDQGGVLQARGLPEAATVPKALPRGRAFDD